MIDHTDSAVCGRPARLLGAAAGLAILVAALAGAPSARAQYEVIGTGAIGDYGSVDALDPLSTGVLPPDGGSQILLTTENSSPTHDGGTVFTDPTNTDGSTGAVPLATLASYILADPGTINYNANNPGTEGSAYGIEVATASPTILSLDYDFVTSELVGSANTHPDFAFATVTELDSTGSFVVGSLPTDILAGAGDDASKFQTLVDPLGQSPFNQQEGYTSLSITLPANGVYVIGLGVADADTFDTQSGLFLDNLALTAVPEPGSRSLLLLAAGCAVATGAWRRFRRAV